MTRTIVLCGKEISYELSRKRVKNLNIRIRTDGSVSVSANSRVSVAEIEQFMRQKAECIINAVDKYSLQTAKNQLSFRSGDKLTLLGKSYTLQIAKSDRCYVTEYDGIITAGVKDTEDTELIKKVFGKWLNEQCLTLMTRLCRKAYDEYYCRYVSRFPVIKVKNMRSRWGSCIPSKNILTFSVRLMEHPITACEYVVAHEFTHFLHPDHSPLFYNELAKYMPDHKQRKALLKNKEEI